MEFKQIKCPIPRNPRPWEQPGIEYICDAYLCDEEVGKPTTHRFTCRTPHAEGHSQRVEFKQDNQGLISYREIPEAEEKKSYAHDNGVRMPMLQEEVAG
jgi:hypothetical protein